jgi:integrase
MTYNAQTSEEIGNIVDRVWKDVQARSIDADRQAIPALRNWLLSQPNPHAVLLGGRTPAGAADERSARELEALLLARVAKKELTCKSAAQQLYLLHRVGKRLRGQGMSFAPTWVSSILRPPPSPFSSTTAGEIAKAQAWRRALNDTLSQDLPQDPAKLWAVTLLSAVCNGALVDRGKLTRLHSMIEHGSLKVERTDSGHAFVDFLMPFEGLGNHHLQRWWCDPATDLLLQKRGREKSVCPFKETRDAIRELLSNAGVAKAQLPMNITDLLASASSLWALKSAPVDLHAMSRTFATHSLTSRCWTRLIGHPPQSEPGALRNPGGTPSAPEPHELDTEAELWQAASAEHEWLQDARAMLSSGDHAQAIMLVKNLLHDTASNHYSHLYMGWLFDALETPPRNKEIGIGLRALAEPFLLAAPRLLGYLGTRQISSIGLDELDELYRVILDACEAGEPVEKIARGLRLFHDHLVLKHNFKPLPDPRGTFGEGGALMPVDATVISVDEYLRAHAWLRQQLQLGADLAATMISQVVLTLSFRCGLRRGEIFGLRLCDVHDHGGMYLHVRRYPTHSLKTPSSTRTIRIDALMTTKERSVLRQWIQLRAPNRTAENKAEIGQMLLLGPPGSMHRGASPNRTVERVMQAVHAVTQEPRLVLHHLRHSCGTWLWLKLRSPDYPELSGMLTSMPALCQELRMARRLRIQLCGAVHGPSRTYSHVVARILGHSTPGTSLEHYIHVADLFLAATVMRCATTTPAPVWQRLTDRSRSTVYEWLQRGPHGVIVGHQPRLEHPHSRPESVQPPPGPEVSPWRKKSKAPPFRFRGTGLLGTISKVLHLYNRIDPGGPNADGVGSVAKALSLSNAQTQVWLDGARLYAPAFGMNAPASSGALLINSVPAPYVDLHRASVEALETLSQCLEQAADEHPGLLREALQIATTRFNLRRLDVCFRGEKDEREARRFLKLLDLSGLVPDHVVLTIRRVDPLDTKLPHWFRTPRARAIKIKRLPPPGTSASQAKAYARWVGIQLCSSDGAAQGAAWRIGLFLASIAFLSPAVPSIED